MNKMKVFLYVIVIICAALLSICFTFMYGSLFLHDRYWQGTIKKVSMTQIKMIEGFFSMRNIGSILESNRNSLGVIFDPLYGKIAVRVYENTYLLYSNINKSYRLSENTIRLPVAESRFLIEIENYLPPTWGENFTSWLLRPGEWLTDRFDYITIPFLGLFAILVCLFYAFLWRYKARYLSRDVFAALNSFSESR